MASRKAIVAFINGRIHIDPNDVPRVDMEKIQAEAIKVLGKRVEVVIAPINEWMPASGTKALMDEAMKNLLPTTPAIPKSIKIKNKHGKRYF